jgi:phosphoglycolate phosphatase-like HAD superfamily hydrolase
MMTSRIDELFSAENLRQNWQRQIISDNDPLPIALNRAIHAKYQKLQQLLVRKYEDISCLSVNFDELTEAINQTYPLEGPSLVVEAKDKERLVSMLEQLETLVWAMSLSKGRS